MGIAHATLLGMHAGRASWTLALLTVALAAGEVADDAHAERAMCTLAPLEMRLRIPDHVAFIGTIDAETVLAGPGVARYSVEQGHYGPGTRGTIYGQVARVERPERGAPGALHDAIAANRSVVLVPWDFSASCEPVPWARSARWLTPGTRAVFVGKVRNRAHWTGDRPTFDVTPEVAIYPSRSTRPTVARLMTGSTLSPDEYLALYEVLPDWRALRTSPDSAAVPFFRWAEKHPELAAKQPAAYFLGYLRRQVVERRYGERASPLAGTYRVIYRTAAGDSVAFFARTELRPSSVIWSNHLTRGNSEGETNPRPIGHYLLVVAARTLGELPSQRVGSGQLEGYFALVDSASQNAADRSVFSGSIDLEREAARLAPDSIARSRLEAAGRQKSAFQTELFRRRQPLTPGRFVMTPGGGVRFEMVIEREGVPVLTVRAERVSTEHLQPRDP